MQAKDVALDQCASETASQEKERSRLSKELEEATAQIARHVHNNICYTGILQLQIPPQLIFSVTINC
jgi:hypothetical protein